MESISYVGYIEVLLDIESIHLLTVRCVVEGLVGLKNAHILLVIQILWGIQLVLLLRFSCFRRLCQVLTCSVGKHSMTVWVCKICL